MFGIAEMNFYYWHEKDKVVVQNAVMGMMGQKHVHTEKDFKQWRKDISPKNLICLDKKTA